MSDALAVSEAARRYLRLHLVEGIGPILTNRLIGCFGSIDGVLRASSAQLRGVRGIGDELAQRLAAVDESCVEREIAAAAAQGVGIVCLEDEGYPVALRHIPDPPVCLYVRGRLQPEDAIALAIVGTRRCSQYGVEQAERFAGQAAECGLTVVSGLAAGIDTAAHRGALRCGGRTIAVLGCGLAHLYPPQNAELARQVAASGALLSEFPMQVHPSDQNFPRRNRIIAGLSLGVLLIEAPKHSGALITARFAGEYNREVYVVPGRIDTPYSEGGHGLVRDAAAKLVTSIADVLDELGELGRVLTRGPDTPPPGDAAAALPSASRGPPELGDLEPSQRLLFAAASARPASVDTLAELTDLPPARVAADLTRLQLRGLIRRVAGDRYVRAGPGASESAGGNEGASARVEG